MLRASVVVLKQCNRLDGSFILLVCKLRMRTFPRRLSCASNSTSRAFGHRSCGRCLVSFLSISSCPHYYYMALQRHSKNVYVDGLHSVQWIPCVPLRKRASNATYWPTYAVCRRKVKLCTLVPIVRMMAVTMRIS